MRKVLGTHSDFCKILLAKGHHICYFLPKFYCELNPIERVWSQAKRYTKAYCRYNINSLCFNIPNGLDSVSCYNIQLDEIIVLLLLMQFMVI